MAEVGERPRGAVAREISAAAVEESGGDGDGERKKESGGERMDRVGRVARGTGASSASRPRTEAKKFGFGSLESKM